MFQILKIILVILVLIPSTAMTATEHQSENRKKKTHSSELDTTHSFPIDEIKNFVNVYSKIKAEFVNPIDDQEIINNAIKGMVDNLDEHSTFLDQQLFAKFDKKLKGDKVGIGIEIAKKNDKIIIMTALYGGPAYRAGIRSGDIIIQIDNMAVTYKNLAKINDVLSGLPNTFVNIYIENSNKEIKMYRLKRTLLKVPSVSQKTLKNQYVHIRISQFQKNTIRSHKFIKEKRK